MPRLMFCIKSRPIQRSFASAQRGIRGFFLAKLSWQSEQTGRTVGTAPSARSSIVAGQRRLWRSHCASSTLSPLLYRTVTADASSSSFGISGQRRW